MHKAKACVITCIDFRFQEQIQDFLEDLDLEEKFDLITIAGASRDFIKPVDTIDGKYVWKQLGLSIKLHDPDEIIFIDHQDCGGYAQDGTIPGGLEKTEDASLHKKYMTKLKKKVAVKYPDKKVKFFHAALDGSVLEIPIP